MIRPWPLLVLVALLGREPAPVFAQLTLTEKSSAKVSRDPQYYPVAFTPDGKTLAMGLGRTAVLVEVSTGKETEFFAHSGRDGVTAVAFSPDGKVLATGSNDVVKLWNVATIKQATLIRGDGQARSLRFSPDGKTLAALYLQQTGTSTRVSDVQLWDVETGKERAQLVTRRALPTAPFGASGALSFRPDGKVLVARWSGTLYFWDMQSEQPRDLAIDGLGSRFAFSPDSKLLAVSRKSRTELRDAETGEEKLTLGIQGDPLAFSGDGRALAVLTESGMELIAVESGKSVRTLNGVGAPLHFSRDGKTLTAVERTTKEALFIKTWELTWEKAPAK